MELKVHRAIISDHGNPSLADNKCSNGCLVLTEAPTGSSKALVAVDGQAGIEQLLHEFVNTSESRFPVTSNHDNEGPKIYTVVYVDKIQVVRECPCSLFIFETPNRSGNNFNASTSSAEVDARHPKSFKVTFASKSDTDQFCEELKSSQAKGVEQNVHQQFQNNHEQPESNVRDKGHVVTMDPATIQTYFYYYTKLSNQSNMMQDTLRTSTYRSAILGNLSDFANKSVMDVGAGSGILSFFAAQAGAAKVYAVEASGAAEIATELAAANPTIGGPIKVIKSTVENLRIASGSNGESESTLSEKVDAIISEPMGTFLLNERMIESVLYARDHFLKPGGKLYPSRARIAVAPFSDAALFHDMNSRARFWNTDNFYGVDLRSVAVWANEEILRQPVVDYIDPNILLAPAIFKEFDLRTVSRQSLQHVVIPLEFLITSPCLMHGLAGWFEVDFDGTDALISFSTSPWSPPTHWYQIRFLFTAPLAVNTNQVVKGELVMIANAQQSYNILCSLSLVGTNISTKSTFIDLRDPDYRYFTSPSSSYYPSQHATQPVGIPANTKNE